MQSVNLTITPLMEPKSLAGLMIVTFEDVPFTSKKEQSKGKQLSSKIKEKHIVALEQELKYSRSSGRGRG
jgi:hypothetical protein